MLDTRLINKQHDNLWCGCICFVPCCKAVLLAGSQRSGWGEEPFGITVYIVTDSNFDAAIASMGIGYVCVLCAIAAPAAALPTVRHLTI